MDWNKIRFRFAVTTQNLERIRGIVPFTFWDLRIESCDVQLFAFPCRVTSETCRVQTCPTWCTAHDTRSTTLVNNHNPCHRKHQLTEAFSESRTISPLDPLAQSFNRWQYLLRQIIIVVCCSGEEKIGFRDQRIRGSIPDAVPI